MKIDEPGSDALDSADPADVVEQHAELDDDAFDDDQPGGADLPWEADPADVAEQARTVSYDDER